MPSTKINGIELHTHTHNTLKIYQDIYAWWNCLAKHFKSCHPFGINQVLICNSEYIIQEYTMLKSKVAW